MTGGGGCEFVNGKKKALVVFTKANSHSDKMKVDFALAKRILWLGEPRVYYMAVAAFV
jgi:hypothetical protein